MQSGSFHVAPGTFVAGRFKIVDLIGEGGFGAVYRAEEAAVGREVALKLIHRPDGVGVEELDQLRARFEQEARALARLNSPFIVKLIELGMHGDRVFIAMEYIRGRPLGELLAEERTLAPLRACAIALQVLQGLAEAHGAGVIHRDLKPDNIMIERLPLGGETIKLLDFGVARFQVVGQKSVKTQDGRVLGTPTYMAPEQGLGKVSPQSDLYALGVMLFEMISGQLPFNGETALEVMTRKLNTALPDTLRRLNLPPSLVKVVEVALAAEPLDRYADARAMAGALQDALADLSGVPAAGGMIEATGVYHYEPTTGAHARGAVEAPAAEDGGRASTWVLIALGGLAAAAAAAFAVVSITTQDPPAAPVTDNTPVTVTVAGAAPTDPNTPLGTVLAQARAADQAGDLEAAEEGYWAFLERAPRDHPERAAVEARIKALQK